MAPSPATVTGRIQVLENSAPMTVILDLESGTAYQKNADGVWERPGSGQEYSAPYLAGWVEKFRILFAPTLKPRRPDGTLRTPK